MSRIILDLCGGTGAWSAPYREAGYDVRLVTLPQDVRLYIPPSGVHGILAAPPCNHFAVSGARWWAEKGVEALLEGLSVVDACLRIIHTCRPEWWALENPVGRLRDYIGAPKIAFNPCDYGDPWTKRTLLWGNFELPKRNPVEPEARSRIHMMPGGKRQAERRSITPPAFARAFFAANP